MIQSFFNVEFCLQGLTKLLADNAPDSMKEQKFESYFGRKIAIDASMSIYSFLVSFMKSLLNGAIPLTTSNCISVIIARIGRRLCFQMIRVPSIVYRVSCPSSFVMIYCKVLH